jgi:hypothetical protein
MSRRYRAALVGAVPAFTVLAAASNAQTDVAAARKNLQRKFDAACEKAEFPRPAEIWSEPAARIGAILVAPQAFRPIDEGGLAGARCTKTPTAQCTLRNGRLNTRLENTTFIHAIGSWPVSRKMVPWL